MKVTHLTAQQVGRKLRQLMDTFDEFHWAVAWATETRLSTKLLAQGDKIRHLVIGTDFDTTSPELLHALLPEPAARRAAHYDGATFHPKVYGFVSGARAAVIVGSCNFTRGGIKNNQEAALLLEGDTQDATLQGLLTAVQTWWQEGEVLTREFIEAYALRCAATRKHREALARPVFVPRPTSAASHPTLLSMSWQDYVAAIEAEVKGNVPERLAILRKAGGLFASVDAFEELDALERKALAGFIGKNEKLGSALDGLDWGWFGGMQGAGVFKNRVNENDPDLSAALDCIAPAGEITEEDFQRFAALYQRAFEGTAQAGGIVTASRLLAMKRPDYFVCVDSKNLKSLANNFGFAYTTLNFETYWSKVVEPIMQARWWQTPRPRGREGRIWDGRAAMLDALLC